MALLGCSLPAGRHIGVDDSFANGEVDVLLVEQYPSAATFADLAALGGSVGQFVWVQSVARCFVAVPSGSSPAESGVLIPGVGVDWMTVDGTSHVKWLAQTDWYIDAVAGNDEASGLLGDPIRTDAERQRRWGGNVPALVTAPSVTLHLAAGTHQSVFVFGMPLTSTCMLTVVGSPSQLFAAKVSLYTKYTHGAYGVTPGQATILSGDTIADWTPYVGKRVRSGALGTLLSWIAKVNPAGGGVGTARVSPFGSQSTAGSRTWSQSDPAVGQDLFVEDLPLVHQLRITWQGAAPSSGVQVLVQDLAFDGQIGLVGNESVRARIYGCDFRTGSLEDFLQNVTVGLARVHACRCAQTQQSDKVWHAGCLMVVDFLVGFTTSTLLSCLVQGGAYGLSVTGAAAVAGTDCQLFDCTSGLVHLQNICNVTLTNVSGTASAANATAIDLADGSLVKTSGTINLLSTTGVEIHFHGFPKVYGQGAIRWSDVPATGFVLGVWSGTKQLTAGLGPVTLAPALTSVFVAGSTIKVWYQTPAAGAGVLGYDSVTTAGFRITSTNLADNTSVAAYEAVSIIPRTNTILPASFA